VHGGGAGAESVSNWQRSFPLFSANGPTYAMDMVGFGNSDAPSPEEFAYTQDARNQQLIDFIDALDLGPARLIGNSMGGCTSLGVAMTRPDLVDSLVLMGSGGRAKAGALSPDLGPVIHYDFTVEGMRAIIGVLANPGFIPSDEQVQYRYDMSIRPELKVAYKATMGWVRENGLYYPDDAIAAVKTRTLVVNGKEDKVVPIEQAYEFLALLENSTGYLIPHCRHWAMIEYPELFSKVCLDFFEDTTAYGVAS
jgi:pimeloyl-ACP methyl ester carboxylesterase